MDKKDKTSLMMLAGGAAVAGATVLASQSLSGLELTNDLLEIVENVLNLLRGTSMIASAIGLARIGLKYGTKMWNWLEEKISNHSNNKKKELAKTHSKSNDSKSSSKGHVKEGEMTGIMKKGFNRGADINLAQQSKPVQKTVSKTRVVQKQSQR